MRALSALALLVACASSRASETRLRSSVAAQLGARGGCTYSAPSWVADCPGGYTNMGATCYQGPDTTTKRGSWCTGGCDGGYTDTGCFCQRWANSYGMSAMTCSGGRFKYGARCYVECRQGYRNDGEFCTNWDCVKTGWDSFVNTITFAAGATACESGASLANALGDGGQAKEGCKEIIQSNCPASATQGEDCSAILKCTWTMLTGDPNKPLSPCALAAISIAETAKALAAILNPAELYDVAKAAMSLAKAQRCLASVAAQCNSG